MAVDDVLTQLVTLLRLLCQLLACMACMHVEHCILFTAARPLLTASLTQLHVQQHTAQPLFAPCMQYLPSVHVSVVQSLSASYTNGAWPVYTGIKRSSTSTQGTQVSRSLTHAMAS